MRRLLDRRSYRCRRDGDSARAIRSCTPPRNRYLPIDAGWLTRLDHVLEQYVQENRIAGAVALVLQDGKPVTRRR